MGTRDANQLDDCSPHFSQPRMITTFDFAYYYAKFGTGTSPKLSTLTELANREAAAHSPPLRLRLLFEKENGTKCMSKALLGSLTSDPWRDAPPGWRAATAVLEPNRSLLNVLLLGTISAFGRPAWVMIAE